MSGFNMEVSVFPESKRRFWCSAESSLLGKGRHPSSQWFSLSISPTKITPQPLLCRSRFLSPKKTHFKVLSIQRNEIPVVEGSSIDEVYDSLAEQLLPTAAVASNPNSKFIVGLAGPPGAGKTTLALEVVRRVNMRWPQKAPSMDSQVKPQDVAIILPMDGFHLYRHQLDAMEDPEEAHARRGAPWTFDPARLLACLKALRSQGSVYVPSFDHGVGDPVEDDIFVNIQHKVVIVEGNYVLLEDGIWKEVSSMFDKKWFIEVDIGKAMNRVLKRHISTGKPPDIAKWRIAYNDRPNAELINKSKKNADLIIRSVDF
ncbi:PREDICTED: putative uridine kinase C227.14 [Nelumbo nucifera]|uniref:Uridine kinase C227.14 n=1 Tax=Nelumbo nucifera TaxID=4432 RepID=A0A1U8BLJ1_NELNU|nr:PREDICTED: putative uridine kinase C227.14 [Nelumbo nucifera]